MTPRSDVPGGSSRTGRRRRRSVPVRPRRVGVYPPGLHVEAPVGQLPGHGQVLLHEEDGGPRGDHLAERGDAGGGGAGRRPRRGLVEEEDAGSGRQHTPDGDELRGSRWDRANSESQATLESHRRYVQMMVHDLRHPLTSLRLLLHLARNETSAALRQQRLDEMDSRLTALSELVDELAECHRIEAGHGTLNLELVDIGELVAGCIASLKPACLEYGCPIFCGTGPTMMAVVTDAVKLRHIIINLMSNALKFTSTGSIAVTWRAECDDRWSLAVEDTGCGMHPADRNRACEEYVQAGPADPQSGYGLGLTIVKRLCEVLNADLDLSSAIGLGTSVRIIFPVHVTEQGSV